MLNFGHAFGHAIETSVGYRGILHGEAVSIGMCVELAIGVRLGITPPDLAAAVVDLLDGLGLPTTVDPARVGEVRAHMDMIEAIRGGFHRFVIPTELGRSVIVPTVDANVLADALDPS